MLTQSILLVFALMGIAALVVDMGYVRLSQVQMQSGVDTAALEGLRQRDALGNAGRRQAAVLMVTGAYTDPAGERLVGAGPELTLTGGVTEANGSQLLSVSADPVYRPQLAENLANVVHGDMVSGTFGAGVTGMETGAYTRDDFAPAAGGTAPAFLVRMRRTDGRNALDAPDGATVSTGRSLPLLFGLATTLQRAPGSDYSVRFDGITVRATAIADGRPARRISNTLTAPFALNRDFWVAMPDGAPVVLDVDPAGVLRSGLVVAGLYTAGLTSRIGEPIAASGIAGGGGTGPLYVPVYADIAGTSRVIGFGYMTAAGGGGGLLLARARNRVAEAGASIHVAEGFAGVPDLALLLAANSTLDGALLAPALVR
ncbi:MAG: pilus assembly protein TadG-related protein [Bryobacteraceae bacterium]|nr:pilus assembly protein TadG-related protein [Bryobacteraceae bacterium]